MPGRSKYAAIGPDVIRRWKSGETYSSIAKYYGLKPTDIGGIIYRYRHPIEVRSRAKPADCPMEEYGAQPEPHTLYAVCMVAEGGSPTRIGEELGITDEDVHKAARRSMVREAKELQSLPPGSMIGTAWDYSNPRVKRVIAKHGLSVPDNLTLIPAWR